MIEAEDIVRLHERFMGYIEQDPRSASLKGMYDAFGDVLTDAPASSKVHFHNSFPGGYLDHVLRVRDLTVELSATYKSNGGTLGFTAQEATFVALHHDLGKLGDPLQGPLYVEQDSDWHRRRGELYKKNTDIQYMTVPERSLMLLQRYGIQLTETEWLAIRLSDGLYDEGARPYLENYTPYPMKTNLHRIIHWADHMASQIENDRSRFSWT